MPQLCSFIKASFLALVAVTFLQSSLFAQRLDMEELKGIKARSIGPAGMSGRVTSIDVVLKNPQTIYVGTASGGLWKSTSGGTAWEPIFDTLAVASIGDVAVDQRNPDLIWVGTGEGNPRNSQTNGNGVYRSLDGGRTWIHMGLDNTRSIHRVIIHPTNSDIVYVGATGAAWGENPERGVYKTTDGGKTWEKILYVNEKTGSADLVMDPSNPNKLIAAMWEYRRWPWFFKSGGPGSGIYVTFDAGKTWKKRTDEDGLPKGDLGRIGIAIAPSNPNRVYALIESKKNAFYRSDDGGFKWKKVAEQNIGNRPFYYSEIYVDPKNENRIYNLYSVVSRSEDAGKTFETLISWNVHPDHHAWWIHPEDPDFLIDGNDGGLAISHDRGKTWRFVENLPVAQFYHINVDSEIPYNVYGGMQDNGSWRGPNEIWRDGGIRNSYWEMVLFGDGFDVLPDRSNPRYGYAMSQGGFLSRYDLATGEQRLVRPIHPEGVPLRFNWNAGLAADAFDPTTIYYGSQFLHKSTDRGNTWTIISPDLTTNDTTKQKQEESGGLTFDVTSAENHTTIIAIAPSPARQGVIWVGTDDGYVQVTTDGGASWTNVINRIKGVPEGTWVPQIHASSRAAGEAFVVFDNHRRNDWTPYAYHTTNFGRDWKRIVDAGDVPGYALCIAQDPQEPRLLFLGTEFGLYVSIDAGETWSKWTSGFPTVSTMDLVIHPIEDDLVIGTFGRAAYVLDDIRPLRLLAREGTTLLTRKLHLFPVPDARMVLQKSPAGVMFAAEGEFKGENPPVGALITYVFNPDTSKPEAEKKTVSKDQKEESEKEPKADSVKVEILNGEHRVIRTFKVEAKPGVNRTTWGFERKGVRWPGTPKPEPGAPEPSGPWVLPGTYAIRLTNGKYLDSTTVNVHLDPRVAITQASLESNNAFLERMMSRVQTATDAVDRLNEAKKTIELIAGRLKERNDDTTKAVKDLKDQGKALQDSIKALTELINPPEVQGFKDYPTLVRSELGMASAYINSSWEAHGETERLALEQAERTLARVVNRVNRFFETRWPEYRSAVEAVNLSFFKEYEPLKVENVR
jgi:photosystem II stability/assembly factor-like uncharacterized protein